MAPARPSSTKRSGPKRRVESKPKGKAEAAARAAERRLAESLEQQVATSEILRAISTSRTDVQPVFEMIAANALRLCDGQFSAIFRFDGEQIHIGAFQNLDPEGANAFHSAYPCRPSRGGGTQRAVLTREIVHIADIRRDPEYAYQDVAAVADYRSVLSVPMLRDGRPIGTISVYGKSARRFPDSQIELLKTFADQAIIAIENVRLFTELESRNRDLTEALEQQTATSEVLRVISQTPTDVQPVFDAIVKAALRLCKATAANLFTFDGALIHLAALVNVNPEYEGIIRTVFPRPPGRETVVGRTVLARDVVQIEDVRADPEYGIESQALAGGFRRTLAVPLLREGNLIGAINIGAPEPGPFPESQIALLRTFADQAVIAIENVRLFTELEERNRDLTEALEQQTATSEILRAISSSQTDVQPVFDTIVRSAVRLCDGEQCYAARFDGEFLHPLAHHGFTEAALEISSRIFPMRPSWANMLGRVTLTRAVVNLPDVRADPEYAQDFAVAGGWRSILGVPMLRDGKLIGVIAVARSHPGLFPDHLVALLQTFADQAVIAIENVRLFTELEDRNRDLTEALEQQTATGEVLQVISRSPTDVQPVFDTIARNAMRLCEGGFGVVAEYDGETMQLAAHAHARPEGVEHMRRMFPMRPSRINMVGRAVMEGAVVHATDVRVDADYDQSFSRTLGNRSSLAVPLLREGRPVGAIMVGRFDVRPFSESQIALLQTFASQAVIAVENVRLFRALEDRNRNLIEALEQQTATSEILRVISQSQTDVQPVFDTIVKAALRLCSVSSANLFTFDGELIHLAASVNVNPGYVDELRQMFPRPPSRDTAVTRAILSCGVAAIPDVSEDPEYAIAEHSLAGGFRSVLAVPLIRDGKPIGCIAVGRPEPGAFPETQVTLLKTFADQAVIAIENVRLFTETRDALERQTATSEILQVISGSRDDLQPVFDAISRNAVTLCGGMFANVFRFDGELLHWVSSERYASSAVELMRSMFPMRPSRLQIAGRVILEGTVVRMEDALADPDYDRRFAHAGGWRRMLGVPMLREGNPIGVIVVGWAEAGPIAQVQEDLLKTFADQAVIAIENVRLFREVEARTAQLTRSVKELQALGEVGQAVSSTLDLETVLSTIVMRAAGLAGMDGGAIYEYDEAREQFHLHTTHSLPDELIAALRANPIRRGDGALGRLAVTPEPVQVADIADERIYQSSVRDLLMRLGYRSLLAIPLLREDHLLGGLVVNRIEAGEFAPQVVELLRTFATQSALAIQNARLFREIESKSRELEVASRHKSEFLANMSHELRTPLNAIIGFSEVLAERMFGEINDKQAEYLNDILESGRHLLSLINDILDLSKIEAGRMELEPSEFDLPGAVENALMLVKERAQRRAVTLGCDIDASVGRIRGDERKVKQVLLNLLSNALKFTPEGGSVDVRARVADGAAEVSVADTGVGIAPEDQEAVFEEFRQVGASAKKVEGTGLGLAISRKFIELHGGRIWVQSQPGAGSTFTFTLPLN